MNEQFIDARLYQVVVNRKEGGAMHLVHTYHISDQKKHIGANYDRRFHSFPSSKYNPEEGDSEFKTQLLEFEKASDIWTGNRNKETSRIHNKMKELYGEDATIDIKQWV